MPEGLVQKLVAGHLVAGEPVPGQEIGLRMDQVLLTDTNGTMAWLQFEAMGFDRVKAPTVVTYADHQVYQFDARNTEDHRYLADGLPPLRRLLLEARATASATRSTWRPSERRGSPCSASDSHTPLCGALGMLAIGAGGLDVACAMGGSPYYLPLPRVIQVVLTGRLRPWVAAKDVILELLRRLTVRGGFGKIFEYAGPGVATPDGAPARDDREHGRRAGPHHLGVPVGRGDAGLPRRASGRDAAWRPLAADPGAALRRHDRDRPLGDRAARRAPRLARPGRAGRRGRGHVDRAGPGRLLHQRLVGGHVRRRRGPARPPRPRRRVVRALPRQPADPRDDGARGSRGRPHRGRRGRLRVDVRRLPRDRPRPGDGLPEPAGLQPQLPRAERRQGRSDLPLVDPDRVRVRAPRRDHGPAAPRRGAGDGLSRPLRRRRRPASCRPAADGAGRRPSSRAPTSARCPSDGRPGDEIAGPVLIKLGDKVSTDDISPSGSQVLVFRSNMPAIAEFTFRNVDPEFVARAKAAGQRLHRGRPDLRPGLVPRGRRHRARCSSGSAGCWRRASPASTART